MAHDTRASEREFRVQAMEIRVANQQATVKLVNTMSDEDVKNQISTLKQNQSGSLKRIHIIEVVGVQPEEGVLARLHGCWLIWRSEVEIASLMRAAGLPPSVAPPDATPRPAAKRPCCCCAPDLAGCCWSNCVVLPSAVVLAAPMVRGLQGEDEGWKRFDGPPIRSWRSHCCQVAKLSYPRPWLPV